MKEKGLTVVFTGDGKGKTSAALGVVFRALGHGYRCRVIQFIKGTMDTGELRSAERFDGQLEILQVGIGFTFSKGKSREEHVAAANAGLEQAEASLGGEYKVVVLDEILYALHDGLITAEDIKFLIKHKPPEMHLVLTGRGATQEVVDLADMVSEIKSVKHPMEQGISAQKGLDF